MSNLPSLISPGEVLVGSLNPILQNKDRARGDLVEYRPWQVEKLLSECISLIDRCVDLKRGLDDLWVGWAQQELKLLEDRYDQSLSDAEAAAFVDSHPHTEALSQLRAIRDTTFRAVDATTGSIAPNSRTLEALGIAAGYSNMIAAKWDGQTHTLDPAKASAFIAHGNSMAAVLDISNRIASMERLEAFELHASERRIQSRSHAKTLRDERRALVSKGPLNYELRIRKLTDALLVPFMLDVFDRCISVQKGLKDIFGIVAPELPPVNLDAVEAYAGWIRAQASQLAKFGHLDQGFVVSIPLSKSEIEKIELGVPFDISMPDQLFDGHNYCRLRGISAFVETDVKGALFRAFIGVPNEATYTDLNGEPMATVSQRLVPRCLLGRVASRSEVREPEVGGSVSLLNASPRSAPGSKSTWTIQIDYVGGGERPAIKEVIIELSLVGRPRL